MIYTAESRALAMAEVVVHLSAASLPRDFVMLTIELPPKMKHLDTEQLPPDWNAFPHRLHTQKMGDEFIQSGEALAMKVPSAVVQGDFNILINPLHPKMNEVRVADIQDFLIDDRFFQSSAK